MTFRRRTVMVIVNYGWGNLESIKNMLKKAGFESVVSSIPKRKG